MDTKITLSFNESVIEKAKRFADKNSMSLSRLTEFLYEKITSGNYNSLEDFEICYSKKKDRQVIKERIF
jgi:Family of unknown function (DUF6364)